MRTFAVIAILLGACSAWAEEPVKPAVPLTEKEQIAALTAERDQAKQKLAAMEKRVAELEKRLTVTEAAHKQLSATHNSLLQGRVDSGAPVDRSLTSPGSQKLRRVGDRTYVTPEGTTYTILPGGEVIRTEK